MSFPSLAESPFGTIFAQAQKKNFFSRKVLRLTGWMPILYIRKENVMLEIMMIVSASLTILFSILIVVDAGL